MRKKKKEEEQEEEEEKKKNTPLNFLLNIHYMPNHVLGITKEM